MFNLTLMSLMINDLTTLSTAIGSKMSGSAGRQAGANCQTMAIRGPERGEIFATLF